MRRIFFYKKLKRRFIWGQVLRGAVALVAITSILFLSLYLFSDQVQQLRCYLLTRQEFVYVSLLISELLGSLFPPEALIPTLSQVSLWPYLGGVFVLASISYAAAIIVYGLGRVLRPTALFQRLIQRYRRQAKQMRRFGGLLIVIAAFTPLPYTVMCLLSGSMGYSFHRFVWFAATRFLRFAFYAYMLWGTLSKLPC